MTFPLFWRRRSAAAPSGDRLGRLRKVLSKADIAFRKGDPEAALAQVEPRSIGAIPPMILDQKLEFPIRASERIAVFAKGFAISKQARAFTLGGNHEIYSYQPQGLFAGLQDARAIASWSHVLPIEDAMTVLSSPGEDSLLTQHDRDRFWRVFGVPVFEFLQSWDGTVIARECEVHDGLHVVEENAVLHVFDGELLVTQLNRIDVPVVRARSEIEATLIREHCECGLETPRLRDLKSLDSSAAAAA